MIVQETFELNGRQFVRTYSDTGRYVVGGNPETEYAEAVDPAGTARSYVEGGLIDDPDLDDAEALEILLGGAT